jgi:hypothetical protein
MKRLYGSAAAGLLVLLGFRIGGWLVLYLLIVAHHEPLLMRPGLQAGTLLGLLAGEVVLARVRSVRSVERCMVGLPRTRRSVGLGQGLRALIEWALVGAVFFGVVGHPFALSTIEALTLATGSLVVLAAPSADLWLFGDAPAPEQVFTPERVLAASLGFVALGLLGGVGMDRVGAFVLPVLLCGLLLGLLGWGAGPHLSEGLPVSELSFGHAASVRVQRPLQSPAAAAGLEVARSTLKLSAVVALPLVVVGLVLNTGAVHTGLSAGMFWSLGVMLPAWVGGPLFSPATATLPVSLRMRGWAVVGARLVLLGGLVVSAHTFRGAIFPAPLVALVAGVLVVDALIVLPTLSWLVATRSDLPSSFAVLPSVLLCSATCWVALRPVLVAAGQRLFTDWHPTAAALQVQDTAARSLQLVVPIAVVTALVAVGLEGWRWAAGGGRA